MGHNFRFRWRFIATILACIVVTAGPIFGQDELPTDNTNRVTEATAEPSTKPAPTDKIDNPVVEQPSTVAIFTEEMLAQLKEKQQATLDALKEAQRRIEQTATMVEQSRSEATTNAQVATETMDARLKALEERIAMQRSRDLKNLQNSQQFTLVMICLVAGLGIAGVAAMSIYMLRYIHRRTEMVGTAHPIGVPYAAGALGNGNTRLAGPDPAAQSSAQLLGALERIEKRMIELESVTPTETNGVFIHAGQSDLAPEARAQAELQARVSLLLGKGQSLLSLEQFDEAIACLDEAIALDPTNAEAFVKKGTALEKQGHLDEAIENYDRAIVLDDTLTMAYLCKGGVYNRLDRFSEALQCYEQALRAQQDARLG